MDKKIPLHDEHIKLNAKMVPFGGYIMPVQYKLGIIKEHLQVRNSVGLFDISHMGELLITGKDTEKFLQYVMTNDISLLYDGKAQYACMCYDNGTVVDDCFYYKYNSTEYRIIINASNIQKDLDWLNSHISDFDVKISDLSETRGRFAIQGPNSNKTLSSILKDDLSQLKRFHFMGSKIDEYDVFVAFTGYTGENGYEISFNVENSKEILYKILDSGKNYDISPIGLGARDTLRLEATYSLYGHELTDKITPIEANIGFSVKDKPMNFMGKDILLKQKKSGTLKKIVGIELIGRGVIRNGFKVLNSVGKVDIGYITSGGFSPSFKKSIGLALLTIENTKIGTDILIQIRDRQVPAKVVKTPFYKYGV